MEKKIVAKLSPAIHEAFAAFNEDKSYLALPFGLAIDSLQNLPPIRPKAPVSSFQNALNELDAVLNPRTPFYLILRRDDSLVAITFVPYLAKESQRVFFLENRHELVRQLGEGRFSLSMISKEIGELTDARSWDERDGIGEPCKGAANDIDECGSWEDCENRNIGIKDAGYKKNKCRLCDRRMKNKISDEALDALKTLDTPRATVQISIDIRTETLILNFSKADITSEDVAATLPMDKPSFTFYRHPITNLLYFIFHSPDNASVQERMKHTMAIPGLISVYAEDQDVHVDQKIEIHDPEDLIFEAKDERIGKFRSVYLRNKFDGTESTYESLEVDKSFYDQVE